MVIYWDVTKTGSGSHKSGINRVSERLLDSLSVLPSVSLVPVVWSQRTRKFILFDKKREPLETGEPSSFFVSCEVFCEAERVGFEDWLKAFRGKGCLIFHDAIPLQFPEFTWPRSVNRHPHYMKMLLKFDAIFAVSDHSLSVLKSYLEWLTPQVLPSCARIYLGADFDRSERSEPLMERKVRQLVMSGIIEPRKNQSLLLDAVEVLGREQVTFSVHFVGRVNPYFGRPIVKRIRAMKRAGFPVFYEQSVSDEQMGDLYAQSLLSVFPSQAEGCGLPVLESLWSGLPVLASDIPAVREHGSSGGIAYFKNNDLDSLVDGLRTLFDERSGVLEGLYARIASQSLKTWKESAQVLVDALGRLSYYG